MKSFYHLRDQVHVYDLIDLKTKEKIVFTVVGIWRRNRSTEYKIKDDRSGRIFSCNKPHLIQLVKRYEEQKV